MLKFGQSKTKPALKQGKGWTKRDILQERFGSQHALTSAQHMLEAPEQTEEAFLGAQAVLLLQGLI